MCSTPKREDNNFDGLLLSKCQERIVDTLNIILKLFSILIRKFIKLMS